MDPSELWEDRQAMLSMAICLCTIPGASIEIQAASTAQEAYELATVWREHLRGRNQAGSAYWERHQADCKALACYHLQKLAEIIGWHTNATPEPTAES